MTSSAKQPFDRSGLAALSDLASSAWRERFEALEAEQAEFMVRQDEFLSPGCKYFRAPLHTWSRVWEYPYVYHHLRAWRSGSESLPTQPIVADVGSGVTFFPFSVARLGCRVVCTDIDPGAKKSLAGAAGCMDQGSGRVEFRLSEGTTLPFADEEADAAYCISVLEHVPAFDELLSEMARTLKPEGLLLLTIDLDIRGNFELGVEAHRRLLASVERHFDWAHPERSVHPADVLYSDTGLYPHRFERYQGVRGIVFALRQLVKPLFGRKSLSMFPRLAVQGFALRRK